MSDVQSIHTPSSIHGLIPGGQNSSKRQTVFFTSVDPMSKEHRDLNKIAWKHGVLHCTIRESGRNIKTRSIGSTSNLLKKKGFKFYQTRSNAIILHDTPSLLYPEDYHDGIWRNHASPRPPPKISFKDNWMEELGSEVAGGGKDSEQTQPKTQNPIVRTGRPVLSEQQSRSSVQEIEIVSYLASKAPMKEQGDLFSSCVPVSVKRLDQD